MFHSLLQQQEIFRLAEEKVSGEQLVFLAGSIIISMRNFYSSSQAVMMEPPVLKKIERWGFFPSFSAGYNIAKEDFWNNMASTIPMLKLIVNS